jgi:dimethylsulfone monooxygenase
MELGIFAPSISGSTFGQPGCPFIVSRVPTRTDWRWEYNLELARLADEYGFGMYFIGGRFRGHGESRFHGYQLEAVTLAASLASVTKQIKLVSTVHTGLWHPGIIAKVGATIDQVSHGRWIINIVSGWVRDEYDMFGIPWLEHGDRYDMSREFIAILKGMWTQERFDFAGRYFHIENGYLEPKPIQQPHCAIVNAGTSPVAKQMTADLCDWYFSSSYSLEQLRAEVEEVKRLATAQGRTVRVVTYAFVLCRETAAQAQAEAQDIRDNADYDAARVFAERMILQTIGTRETLMGATSEVSQQILDMLILGLGARPLVGSPEQVATGLQTLAAMGADAVLLGFPHYIDDLRFFRQRVTPLLQEAGIVENYDNMY